MAMVTIGGTVLHREELLGAATALAARVAGLPAVAIRADPAPHTVVALVAGLLAGVPVVPVPADSGPVERGHIVRDSGAALLLAAEPDTWPDTGLPVLPVPDPAAGLAASGGGLPDEPPPDATALIIYTSGTTGAPKGVPVARAAIAADLDALAQAWAWTPDDTLVHGLPLFHVHGLVLGLLGPLRIGSPLVHTGRPAPQSYAAAGGTLYFGVPTVWSRVCADPAAARALAGARLLVSGSAPLPASTFAKLRALTGQAPVERYGMTETLITVSARADGPRLAGTVGAPLPCAQTRLAAEDGTLLPHDGQVMGELQVRGPVVFGGYLGAPRATAASLTDDGWFRTGDLAIIGADGLHQIAGRISTDLIKSGGFKVAAGEVEAVLLDHPGVREAAVIGTPHADLGEEIIAFVVADPVGERVLIDFVASRLSVHKRPRRVVFVPELPRNHLGKVLKKQLTP
jgi:fatty acid CoA ligase FadD36